MAEQALMYAAKWLLYYFIFGMTLHVADRYFGVPFYRWYYNRGQKEPDSAMPSTVEMGFMYNRSFKRRRIWALTISTVQSAYTAYRGEVFHLGAEAIILVFEAAVLLVGFRAGTWAYSFVRKQEGLTETVDRVGESIERANAAQLLARWIIAPIKRAGNFVRRVPAETPPSREPAGAAASSTEQSAAPALSSLSANEILKRHSEGRPI